MKRQKTTILMVLTLATLLLASPDVWAGCGCDHPTPCPTPVMPGFSSPGDRIKLTGEDFSTEEDGNKVSFGESYMKMTTEAVARTPETLFVNVPDRSYASYMVGPMPIQVKKGYKTVAEYDKDQFTYLEKPLVLEEGQGHYIFSGFRIAVDTFGVIYIPLDVSKILASTHFMVFIEDLPLEFGTEDTLIFNKDGFNLNLFTLDVEGYEKQWGDWYGAQGISNSDPTQSDMFTYWRHDFYAYNAAHQPGGEYYTHTENEDGYLLHDNGSIHVDHDRLVVAIAGKLRDSKDPENLDKMTSLTPGNIRGVKIHVLQLQTEDPNVWEHLSPEQEAVLANNLKVATPYYPGFMDMNSSYYKYFSGDYNFSLPKGIDDDDDDDHHDGDDDNDDHHDGDDDDDDDDDDSSDWWSWWD